VPLDESFVGRVYPPAFVYEVGREKIREFAEAIGDPDPVFRDPAAARAAGHPDVIAPPTFLMVLSLPAQERLVGDPALGLDYSRVVHGKQSFRLIRPVRAGDRLTIELRVEGIRARGGTATLDVRGEVCTEAGEPVGTVGTTLAVREPEPPAGDEPVRAGAGGARDGAA
jgi:acyl dehydratase